MDIYKRSNRGRWRRCSLFKRGGPKSTSHSYASQLDIKRPTPYLSKACCTRSRVVAQILAHVIRIRTLSDMSTLYTLDLISMWTVFPQLIRIQAESHSAVVPCRIIRSRVSWISRCNCRPSIPPPVHHEHVNQQVNDESNQSLPKPTQYNKPGPLYSPTHVTVRESIGVLFQLHGS